MTLLHYIQFTLPRVFALILLSLLVTGCEDETPVNIGFLGGVSGRVADLGIGGRNGAMLAVEMQNSEGGIDGRPIQLLVEDDKQDPQQAIEALQRLIDKEVVAVIGPMTSSMAVTVVPLANKAGMLLMSPTSTTTELSGKDDHFLRVISSTTAYARKSAEYHYHKQGSRRVAVIYDLKNSAYTKSWLADYRKVFEKEGGQVQPVISFSSNSQVQFSNLVRQVEEERPDSLLILANSVDTALIAQQLRQRNQTIFINTSEWAATERLIELGGKAVEGSVMAQFVDRESTHPGYLKFRNAYQDRYGQEPGFAGLTGYDAANVLIDALKMRQTGQSLKQVILDKKVFAGAQSDVQFDASGDALRDTFLTTIKNGKYHRLN